MALSRIFKTLRSSGSVVPAGPNRDGERGASYSKNGPGDAALESKNKKQQSLTKAERDYGHCYRSSGNMRCYMAMVLGGIYSYGRLCMSYSRFWRYVDPSVEPFVLILYIFYGAWAWGFDAFVTIGSAYAGNDHFLFLKKVFETEQAQAQGVAEKEKRKKKWWMRFLHSRSNPNRLKCYYFCVSISCLFLFAAGYLLRPMEDEDGEVESRSSSGGTATAVIMGALVVFCVFGGVLAFCRANSVETQKEHERRLLRGSARDFWHYLIPRKIPVELVSHLENRDTFQFSLKKILAIALPAFAYVVVARFLVIRLVPEYPMAKRAMSEYVSAFVVDLVLVSVTSMLIMPLFGKMVFVFVFGHDSPTTKIDIGLGISKLRSWYVNESFAVVYGLQCLFSVKYVLARSLIFFFSLPTIFMVIGIEVFISCLHYMLKYDRRWLIVLCKYNRALRDVTLGEQKLEETEPNRRKKSGRELCNKILEEMMPKNYKDSRDSPWEGQWMFPTLEAADENDVSVIFRAQRRLVIAILYLNERLDKLELIPKYWNSIVMVRYDFPHLIESDVHLGILEKEEEHQAEAQADGSGTKKKNQNDGDEHHVDGNKNNEDDMNILTKKLFSSRSDSDKLTQSPSASSGVHANSRRESAKQSSLKAILSTVKSEGGDGRKRLWKSESRVGKLQGLAGFQVSMDEHTSMDTTRMHMYLVSGLETISIGNIPRLHTSDREKQILYDEIRDRIGLDRSVAMSPEGIDESETASLVLLKRVWLGVEGSRRRKCNRRILFNWFHRELGVLAAEDYVDHIFGTTEAEEERIAESQAFGLIGRLPKPTLFMGIEITALDELQCVLVSSVLQSRIERQFSLRQGWKLLSSLHLFIYFWVFGNMGNMYFVDEFEPTTKELDFKQAISALILVFDLLDYLFVTRWYRYKREKRVDTLDWTRIFGREGTATGTRIFGKQERLTVTEMLTSEITRPLVVLYCFAFSFYLHADGVLHPTMNMLIWRSDEHGHEEKQPATRRE